MGILEQFAEIKGQEGLEKGRKEGRLAERELFVTNLLTKTEFSLDKIASLANVTEEFVTKIKESLNAK